MSRHGEFPTSTRLFPVDDVAGQWELEGMPLISGHRPKVLIARKGAQAKWQGVVLPPLCSQRGRMRTPRDGVRYLSSRERAITPRWGASTAQAARLWATLHATS